MEIVETIYTAIALVKLDPDYTLLKTKFMTVALPTSEVLADHVTSHYDTILAPRAADALEFEVVGAIADDRRKQEELKRRRLAFKVPCSICHRPGHPAKDRFMTNDEKREAFLKKASSSAKATILKRVADYKKHDKLPVPWEHLSAAAGQSDLCPGLEDNGEVLFALSGAGQSGVHPGLEDTGESFYALPEAEHSDLHPGLAETDLHLRDHFGDKFGDSIPDRDSGSDSDDDVDPRPFGTWACGVHRAPKARRVEMACGELFCTVGPPNTSSTPWRTGDQYIMHEDYAETLDAYLACAIQHDGDQRDCFDWKFEDTEPHFTTHGPFFLELFASEDNHILDTYSTLSDTCFIKDTELMYAYISQMINTYGLTDANPTTSPMSPSTALSPSDGKDATLPYRALLEQLHWVARCSLPDIKAAVPILSRFSTTYGLEYFVALKQVFRYPKGTMDYELVLRTASTPGVYGTRPSMPLPLSIYTDADYAGCTTTRRSISRIVVFLCGSLVIFVKCVSLSTTEAAIIAMSEGAREVKYILNVLGSLVSICRPVRMYCDNQGAIRLASDYVNNSRSKHIEVRKMYIRELIKAKETKALYTRIADNTSNIMPKPLELPIFRVRRERLGAMSLPCDDQ
ncbi:hypothetical protein CYMTET_38258 [Cymbomonas tetramitiformis]|uniref:Uncharacterized protein n=1 Tax=Cymbomonas tetramitiformis TaxID=36881 RepID=A0AAE0CCB8_9CHLO|nr:hypothetical protein CYMTET_38258 [Cymbomonas tetramitiformis]